jgi:hypothetical protein
MPIARDNPAAKAHRQAALDATYDGIRKRKAAQREERVGEVAARVGQMSDRELFLVGVAIYWAEGTKSKPWRTQSRLAFINSDPSMVLTFLRWLELLGKGRHRCIFRIQIHESADVDAAEAYWAGVVGIGVADLKRTTLKRHNPKTVRYNIGEDYHGCLTIDVRRSAALYELVEGAWRAIGGCAVEDSRLDRSL